MAPPRWWSPRQFDARDCRVLRSAGLGRRARFFDRAIRRRSEVRTGFRARRGGFLPIESRPAGHGDGSCHGLYRHRLRRVREGAALARAIRFAACPRATSRIPIQSRSPPPPPPPGAGAAPVTPVGGPTVRSAEAGSTLLPAGPVTRALTGMLAA